MIIKPNYFIHAKIYRSKRRRSFSSRIYNKKEEKFHPFDFHNMFCSNHFTESKSFFPINKITFFPKWGLHCFNVKKMIRITFDITNDCLLFLYTHTDGSRPKSANSFRHHANLHTKTIRSVHGGLNYVCNKFQKVWPTFKA